MKARFPLVLVLPLALQLTPSVAGSATTVTYLRVGEPEQNEMDKPAPPGG